MSKLEPGFVMPRKTKNEKFLFSSETLAKYWYGENQSSKKKEVTNFLQTENTQ